MSHWRPTATITINGQALSTAEAGLAGLQLILGLNSHDSVWLNLWRDSVLAGTAPGSDAEISLNDELIWTGTINANTHHNNQQQLQGLALTAQLSQIRRSTTWSDMSVADIVTDLASPLQVDVDADLMFSSYSIDNRRSAWAHLQRLAHLAGAEISCSGDGELHFITAGQTNAPVDIRYGAELLNWQLRQQSPTVAVGSVPRGSASSAGQDKWHWINHDPLGGDTDVKQITGAFHSRDAADSFTENNNARANRTVMQGDLWVMGNPELRPGMWVSLNGIPGEPMPVLRLLQVEHHFASDSGFISRLQVQTASEQALPGIGL